MQFIQKLNRLIQTKIHKYSDYYVLRDVFTSSEISQLKSKMTELRENPYSKKDRASDPKGRKNQLFVIQPPFQLFKDMAERLDRELPFAREDYDYFSMNFYELQIAYALHCDNLGKDEGHYQMVIPLDFEPQNRAPYTIIFDQTSPTHTEWVSPVYKKGPDYKPYHNKPIFDPTYYPNWSDDYKISEEDGVKYWGSWWEQTYREAYKGFSIKYAYQWKIGDIFVFNSKFNHCASFLDIEGMTKKKTGILVCLQQPLKD